MCKWGFHMKKIKALTNIEVASFCNELSLLLNSGIPPFEALNYMGEDSVSEEGIQILKNIQSMLLDGKLFHEALRDTNVFPVYMVEMIKLGEETGNIDMITKKLASYYDQQVSIKRTIKNAVTYPFLMLILMLTIIVLLLTKVLPLLNQVFSQLGTELSGIAKKLLNLGTLLNTLSVTFLVIVMIIICILLFFVKCKKGQVIAKHALQTCSLTKNIYLDIAYSRFAACLSLIQASGIDLYTGLGIIDGLIDNQIMSAKIEQCKTAILNHEFIYDALKQANIFKPSQLRLLQIAYKTGESDQELDKLSVYYENKVNEKIQSLLELIEPTLVIIFSLIVGSILLSVILPLIGIMSQIG